MNDPTVPPLSEKYVSGLLNKFPLGGVASAMLIAPQSFPVIAPSELLANCPPVKTIRIALKKGRPIGMFMLEALHAMDIPVEVALSSMADQARTLQMQMEAEAFLLPTKRLPHVNLPTKTGKPPSSKYGQKNKRKKRR